MVSALLDEIRSWRIYCGLIHRSLFRKVLAPLPPLPFLGCWVFDFAGGEKEEWDRGAGLGYGLEEK